MLKVRSLKKVKKIALKKRVYYNKMEKANDEANFNCLKEMLLDERKLVTYVSLSKEMCIHVNESKTLLKQIVDYLKKEDPDILLNINYIVSGLLDNNRAQTIVCNETELEVLKENLKVIFYQHLYSVSVGASSVDNVSFMALNKFADFSLCIGLIKSQSCVKRSSDEIGSLKINSQENITIDQKPSISGQKTAKLETKNISNGVSEVKQPAKIQETKSEPIIKSEIISPKKQSANSNLQKSDHKNITKAQKGIAGFFNKSNSVPAKRVVNGTKENDQQKDSLTRDTTKVKTENMDVDDVVSEKSDREKPQRKQTVKAAKETNKTHSTTKTNAKVKTEEMDIDEVFSEKLDKESKKKQTVKEAKEQIKTLNTIKKNAKVDKKRKRVLHVSDSESEDDPFVEEPVPDPDSDDEIPPTPLVNTVKITSGIVNPKKKRKIVDKTYTDEDGYILTKKEEVYESCSENEEEVSVKENVHHVNKVKAEVSPPGKKNGTKNSKKKIPSPQKGKQATLMSFFKKVPQK